MKNQRLDHAATLRNVETSGGPRESSIRIVSTPFEALEPRDLSRRKHTRWLFNSCYHFINLSLKSSRNIESSPADYSKSSCSKEHCARYGRPDGYPLIDSTSMELYFHIHKFPTIVFRSSRFRIEHGLSILSINTRGASRSRRKLGNFFVI